MSIFSLNNYFFSLQYFILHSIYDLFLFMITVALVDDTIMFRKLLTDCINKWQGFTVIMQANNGIELLNQLNLPNKNLPDVVLLDIQMPIMNGFETAEQLHMQYPKINMLALSQFGDEVSINKMITKGVLGFISKNADLYEIQRAISFAAAGRYYFNEFFSENSLNNTHTLKENYLSARDILLIKLCSTNMPVKQMAEKLNTGVKNVNKIKHNLFQKFNVTNRSSLISAAIKNKIINDSDL